jgi:peptide/nickel transport system permease protein
MVNCVLIGIPLGILSATRKGSFYERGITFYSMLTGGLPDFWLGLILVFIFYYLLGIAPPPMGRMGISAIDLRVITGLNLVDSIIQGNWKAFEVAIRYLTLPVLTLVLVYTGNIIKMTRSSMEEVMESDFMDYARACGLPNKTVISYQLRNALSPVVTVIAFTNGYLLGGSVLVESVFSWGGMGQYAVQSVTQADYWPLQGFVLVAAMYMAINYLILDIVNMVIDPRIAVQ